MIELKNFIDLNTEERLEVLSWRNHEGVRVHMYTDELITLKNHNAFIDSLSQRKDKAYFIVIKNTHPIGVVDLVDITKTSASLGLYANPFSDRKGIGKIILRAVMKYAYETLQLTTLRLECFEENEKAKLLYQKFDFKETKRIVKHNKSIICMEHHREHWSS